MILATMGVTRRFEEHRGKALRHGEMQMAGRKGP